VGEGVRNQERQKESGGKRRGKEESEGGGERGEAGKRGREWMMASGEAN
jgi:hypothetical protein